MDGRDLFEIWAPTNPEQWTKFAKPALFVNMKEEVYLGKIGKSSQTPHIPTDIIQLNNKATAIILDLPGASGVENGIELAKLGFRPVPLYNGVNEHKIGYLSQIIDNTPIVNALMTGAELLKNIAIADNAPPIFLLDYDRNKEVVDSIGKYDNRWSIDFEDMPSAEYMKHAGINRVAVWTNGEIHKDLLPILESYQDTGIEIITYSDGKLAPLASNNASSLDTAENIRKFENARFGLLLISVVVLVNLFFMFFVRLAPLWWTAPSIMWLTYLWVPEIIGDVLAVVITGTYLIFYFLSLRRRNLMAVALAFFGFDVAVFYVYAVYYGLSAWFGGLGLILLVMPIVFLVLLIRGVAANTKLSNLDEAEYFRSLDKLDETRYGKTGRSRRRHLRGFRGYGGYGGSGYGGYSGRGYRGYGRGYGG